MPKSFPVPPLAAQTQLSVATSGVTCWSQINIPDIMFCRKGIRVFLCEAACLCLLFPSVHFMGLIFKMQIFPTLVLFPFIALTKRLRELQQNFFMVFRNCAISQIWNNILRGSSLLQMGIVGKNASEDETQQRTLGGTMTPYCRL